MTKLMPVGWYRELSEDPEEREGLPSMIEFISESPQEQEQEIVAYLRNAVCVGARGCYVDDILDPSCKDVLVPHLYTDGVYLWRLDIAHYVEKYHLRLPQDFIQHMARRNWQPPARDQVDVSSLVL